MKLRRVCRAGLRRMMVAGWVAGVCVCAVATAGPAAAEPAFVWQGEKSLLAVTRDAQVHRIGTVTLSSPSSAAAEGADDRVAFQVRMDPRALQDYFLSMREFKCLPSAVEVTCHVPYPHAQPGWVTPGDLRWLEHNLLFLFKQPADHGAKLWNGLIFRFVMDGNRLVGRPQAIDLNHISAPPAQDTPPLTDQDRDDVQPNTRWLSGLRIE
jgi:hypothetical protein